MVEVRATAPGILALHNGGHRVFIDRLGVGLRLARSAVSITPPWSSGYVYNDRAWTHLLNHVVCYQFPEPWHQDKNSTDHDILSNASFDIEIRHEVSLTERYLLGQTALSADIQNSHLSTQS